MGTKPTNTIDWAPADPADIVEPAGGDKTNGFDPGQKPPAQWFNWFWKLATDWVKYLDTFLADAHAWTGAQTFSHNVIANGQSGDQNPAIDTTDTPTTRKLLWRSRFSTGAPAKYLRFYASNNGLEITLNARWDGSNWIPDSTGSFSSKLRQREDGIAVAVATSGPASFTDANLNSKYVEVTQPAFQGFVVGTVNGGGNPIGQLTDNCYGSLNNVGSGGGQPAFQNNFRNRTGDLKMCFYRTPDGLIHVEGMVEKNDAGATNGSGQVIFTLPSGWRPQGDVFVPVIINDAADPGLLAIYANGNVAFFKPTAIAGNAWTAKIRASFLADHSVA